MNNMANDSPIVIQDLNDSLNYLSQLQLANPLVAERQLIQLLDGLLLAPPEPTVLLATLEQLRAPLCFVEEEMARRYHNRSLPLGEEEESYFQQVVTAWRKMGKAYALCARLEEPATQDAQYLALVALILHRCLYYTGMVILEHYRARRELPPGIWLDLHGFFETADEWGVAYTPVEDGLENSLQATHCAAAYVTLLLIDMASPYSNSVRNLNLIRRWATLWAPLVSLHKIEFDHQVPAFMVELMKDASLHPASAVDEPGDDARMLDTSRLGLQISHMLSQLRQKITPSQLGLGEETSAHVINLLEHLSRPWTQTTFPRRFRRFETTGIARIALGFEAIHFCVTGEEFSQPDSASAFTRSQFNSLFVFRDQAEPTRELVSRPHINYPVDEWSVINHSASGFRLSRTSAGQRLIHGQLMGVFPHDGEQILLAQATWLMEEHDGGLIAGVATLPGMPEGICVRPVPVNDAPHERYQQGFMLPAMPSIREEASLVIPSGMYHAGRLLEIFSGGEDSWRVRMNHILKRGADFDHISFQAI